MDMSNMDDNLQNEIQRVKREVSDTKEEVNNIKVIVHGPKNYKYMGLITRIEKSEEKIGTIETHQNALIKDHEEFKEKQVKRDKTRSRINAFILTAFGGIIVGIVVELFSIAITGTATGAG